MSLPRITTRDTLSSYFEEAMGNLDSYRLVAFAQHADDDAFTGYEFTGTQAARALDFAGVLFY